MQRKDLRHTHASRLITAGIPLPVIQKRLGYESITTTVSTYGHLLLAIVLLPLNTIVEVANPITIEVGFPGNITGMSREGLLFGKSFF